MAAGDLLLDTSGSRILSSDGSAQLSDGTNDACCCAVSCPDGCSVGSRPTDITVAVNLATQWGCKDCGDGGTQITNSMNGLWTPSAVAPGAMGYNPTRWGIWIAQALYYGSFNSACDPSLLPPGEDPTYVDIGLVVQLECVSYTGTFPACDDGDGATNTMRWAAMILALPNPTGDTGPHPSPATPPASEIEMPCESGFGAGYSDFLDCHFRNCSGYESFSGLDYRAYLGWSDPVTDCTAEVTIPNLVTALDHGVDSFGNPCPCIIAFGDGCNFIGAGGSITITPTAFA